MSNNYLLLVDDKTLYPSIQGVDIENIYTTGGVIFRILRRIHLSTGVFRSATRYWLDKWRHRIMFYDRVVVFDTLFNDYPLLFIQERAPKTKICLCYRNRVGKEMWRNPSIIRKRVECDIWTYSVDDADMYGLKLYSQFIIFQPSYENRANVNLDIFFIGTDKGRISLLADLYKVFQNYRLKTRFIVVPDRGKKYNEEERKFLGKQMPYSEVLENILDSHAVLDLVSESNYGMTYRCLEAVFMRKKLITNYREIKNVDFYCKENIFVLGEDSFDRLEEFIKTGYSCIKEEVLKKYTFSHVMNEMFN